MRASIKYQGAFVARLQRGRITKVGGLPASVYNQMVTFWHRAIAEFVRHAILQVHIDTGMSAASLLPLARQVRILTETNFTHGPARLGMTDLEGEWHSGRYKSYAEGLKAGEKAKKILLGSRKRPVLQFEFSHQVFQYRLHDLGLGGQPAWNSLGVGKRYMNLYIKKNLPRVGKAIAKWIMFGEVAVREL